MPFKKYNKQFKNPHNPQFKAARKLLRAGEATMAEVAILAGVSRQHIYRLTQDLNPVIRRDMYLRRLWKRTVEDNDD